MATTALESTSSTWSWRPTTRRLRWLIPRWPRSPPTIITRCRSSALRWAAFYAFAYPAPPGLAGAALSPATAHWDQTLGEYILDWDDVRAAPDPRAAAVDFLRSAFQYASR